MTTTGAPGRRRSPRGVRGMTLIEVVVAMAVLSLIVLVLGASLRGMAQSARRIDERVDVVDEMRVAVAFLREVFARLPETPGAKPTPAPRFAATASEVSWVAVMPARFGAAGRHHFRLAVEPVPDGTPALVLRYTPWRSDIAAPDWTQADARVLARRVERLALRFGGTGMQSAWQPAWAQGERPPARLRIDLATAAMAWPPLVVPVHDLSAAPGAGRFVVGGSR